MPIDLGTRFWSKVNKHGPKVEKYVLRLYPELRKAIHCWVWTGGRRGKYGCFSISQDNHISAHRFSFGLTRKFVCHKCDNPLCVRPIHLFRGSFKSNAQDKINKGRESHSGGTPKGRYVGENRYHKLTEKDVSYIRRAYSRHKRNGRKLAFKFNVSPALICLIVKGKNWTHSFKEEK